MPLLRYFKAWLIMAILKNAHHTANLDFVGEIERIQTEQKQCLLAAVIKASGAIIRTAALGFRSSSLMFLPGAPW